MKPYEYTSRIYRLCQLAIMIAVALYWREIIALVQALQGVAR